MLKTILNLNGVELLSKNQQKKIEGKLGVVAECVIFAPVGASSSQYPNYPCAHVPGTIPTLCPDPLNEFGRPIIC